MRKVRYSEIKQEANRVRRMTLGVKKDIADQDSLDP